MSKQIKSRLAATSRLVAFTPFQERWRTLSFLPGREPVIKGITQQVTQPDEAKPLQRMLEMLASGIPVPERQGNVYGDENPDYFKMDAADILIEKHKTDDNIVALKQRQQDIANALSIATEHQKKAEQEARLKSSKANASPVGDASAASTPTAGSGKTP